MNLINTKVVHKNVTGSVPEQSYETRFVVHLVRYTRKLVLYSLMFIEREYTCIYIYRSGK